MSCVIGVDLGTTGCKSIVFDSNGDILGESYIEYPLIVLSDKVIEQDSNDWWELSKQAMVKAVQKSRIRKSRIKAISISSQGISFVPVDLNCIPLSNAISWLDTRAEEQVGMILHEIDEDHLYKITGKRVNAAYVLPKLMWIRINCPQIYKVAHKFLMAHDFILAKLAGEFVTDHTMAGGTLMYNVNTLLWDMEIINRFDIDIQKLPDIRWSGDVVGNIRKEVAEELGLNKNIKVCVGAQDQKAAALGANLDYCKATLSLGTAGAIEILADKPVFDEKKSIPCFTYVQKGQWVLEAVVSTAGASLKWSRNTLFPQMSYKDFDCLCDESPPGSNGVLFYPHLAGAASPYWNAYARGMFYGLSLSTEGKNIARSVLEGIAFQLRTNIKKAEDLGAKIESIHVFGGGSRSKIWCGIISNITGKRITSFASPEIANLGAGILAARGCGLYSNDFGKKILDNKTDFDTNKDIAQRYDEIYKKYITVEKLFIAHS